MAKSTCESFQTYHDTIPELTFIAFQFKSLEGKGLSFMGSREQKIKTLNFEDKLTFENVSLACKLLIMSEKCLRFSSFNSKCEINGNHKARG